jgi:hypothetical protein
MSLLRRSMEHSEENRAALSALTSKSERKMRGSREYLSDPLCVLRCGRAVSMPPMAFAIASSMTQGGHPLGMGGVNIIEYLTGECEVNPSCPLTIRGHPSSFLFIDSYSEGDYDESAQPIDALCRIEATPLSWALYLAAQVKPTGGILKAARMQKAVDSLLSSGADPCAPFHCRFSRITDSGLAESTAALQADGGYAAWDALNGRSLISVIFEVGLPEMATDVILERTCTIPGRDPPLLRSALEVRNQGVIYSLIEILKLMRDVQRLCARDVQGVVVGGDNALHLMMQRGLFGIKDSWEMENCIFCLSRIGVNPLEQNKDGQTPYDLATRALHHMQVYEDGQTPYDLATRTLHHMQLFEDGQTPYNLATRLRHHTQMYKDARLMLLQEMDLWSQDYARLSASLDTKLMKKLSPELTKRIEDSYWGSRYAQF